MVVTMGQGHGGDDCGGVGSVGDDCGGGGGDDCRDDCSGG